MSTIRKRDLSYTINECCEIQAPTEVDLIKIILRIDISMREEQRYIIKFFLAEVQEPIEIYRRLYIGDGKFVDSLLLKLFGE
jgi:hypothetical protein